jgi:ATP phosphoribosyltransferase
VQLGVADVIADVVESGRTLVQAGLEVVGEPLLQSEAVLVANSETAADAPAVRTLIDRLRGIIVAREYAMVEYDIPKRLLDQACEITPGLESPTIAPLSEPDWAAVKAMIERRAINPTMDRLSALGARGILVTDIRTCRL